MTITSRRRSWTCARRLPRAIERPSVRFLRFCHSRTPALDVARVSQRDDIVQSSSEQYAGDFGVANVTPKLRSHLFPSEFDRRTELPIELHGKYAAAIHFATSIARSQRGRRRRHSEYIRRPLARIAVLDTERSST